MVLSVNLLSIALHYAASLKHHSNVTVVVELFGLGQLFLELLSLLDQLLEVAQRLENLYF